MGRVVEKEIGVGDGAAFTTLEDMMRLALRDSKHPGIKALARRLSKGRSEYDAVHAAFEHTWKTIPFRKDPKGIEQVVAPIYTLGLVKPTGRVKKFFRRGGDCDCQATALAAILLAMGIEPKFRVIAHRAPEYTHVYVVAYLSNGRRVPLDTVMQSFGFDNEKRDIIRSAEYGRGDMIQRTLEDGPAQMPAHPCQSGRPCRCGGRCKKKKGCCPQNQNHNHQNSPVNVFVNSGRISANSSVSTRLEAARAERERRRAERERVVRERIVEKPKIYRQTKIYRPNVVAKMPKILMPAPKVSLHQDVGFPQPGVRRTRPKYPAWY